MPYIDWKKLKERVSLRDILDHYGLTEGLTETHRGYEGECPLCGSHAFKVNNEKNAWYCFGECKSKAKGDEHNGGNILDLVARKEGVSVKQAAELIAEWFPEHKEQAAQSRAPSKRKTKEPAPQQHEPEPKEPEPAEASTDEVTPEPQGQGEGLREPAVGPDEPPEILTGRTNRPLPFTLKSIDYEHPELDRLGFEAETLRHFGVGYFTGKGMMHEKVVFPFHSKEGPLVAYVGYSLRERKFRYPDPKDFDRRLELYNYPHCEISLGVGEDSVILVTDLWNVLALYEYGVRNVMALPTEKIYTPQLDLIESLVGARGRVDFVPWTREYSSMVDALSSRFYVRLHRYYDGSEDEFLRQVVANLDQ